MTQSHFVNPNGLPAENHVTSARDLGVSGTGADPGISGRRCRPAHPLPSSTATRVMRNYNSLLDRYPGADGMKTGFICASGYKMSLLRRPAYRPAPHRDRARLDIDAVPRAQGGAAIGERLQDAGRAELGPTPSLGTVDPIRQPIHAQPPNLRDEMCGGHRRQATRPADDERPARGRHRRTPDKQRRPSCCPRCARSERQVRARAAGRDRGADQGVSTGFPRPSRMPVQIAEPRA